MTLDADFIEQEQESLRLAVEATGLGTWDYDPRTGEMLWDERARALFGLSPSTPMGLEDFLLRVHPRDRVKTQTLVRQALRPEGPGHFSVEYRILTTRGVRWVAANGRTFFDVEGRPTRFLGTVVDVTERVHGRIEVERALFQRARLLESMSDGFYALDAQWRLIDMNARAEQLLGVRREESVGRTFWEVFPEAHGSELEEHYRHVLEQGAPESFETLYVPWNRWFEVRAHPNEEGGFSVFFHDITEHKRERVEHERAVEVLAHGDAVFVLDHGYRFVLVNENEERLLRTRREEALGRVFWDVFPETARPDSKYWVEYHRVVEEQVPVRFDEYYAPLDLWTSVSAYPTREGGIAVFFRDVSEAKRAEQFRDRLLGIVGHDLRNPLSHISLATQLLLRQEELSEPVMSGVRRIATSAERMARMIADLLDFTRASVGGGIPLERRRMDLCDLVQATMAEFELTYPGRVLLSCARGAHAGEWDPDRLAQVVSNLVGNALAHGDAVAPVRVTVVAEGPDAVLTVCNAGTPVPPESLPHIFDPFKQAGGNGGRRGLGLGLYIVQQLVRAHGGSISVRSSEEEGTVFTVRLPRTVTAEAVASSSTV
ncbi:PAS domain-containing protein [Pyxidicoccus parkwayensis]|uniref:histidine kinase n=1 Tax=Pyxidicoccus parkwayensis TaxID=2813578 RepID=A0ABX7P4U6_9BACT|nr:HAMP domain-containing sensor histidine kinase [Pyxidicoccus parkwaysis]QSQ25451.1 PAS domain-containing protein [Pyxidicoccus parkwaysis]